MNYWSAELIVRYPVQEIVGRKRKGSGRQDAKRANNVHNRHVNICPGPVLVSLCIFLLLYYSS